MTIDLIEGRVREITVISGEARREPHEGSFGRRRLQHLRPMKAATPPLASIATSVTPGHFRRPRRSKRRPPLPRGLVPRGGAVLPSEASAALTAETIAEAEAPPLDLTAVEVLKERLRAEPDARC